MDRADHYRLYGMKYTMDGDKITIDFAQHPSNLNPVNVNVPSSFSSPVIEESSSSILWGLPPSRLKDEITGRPTNESKGQDIDESGEITRDNETNLNR